MEQEQLNLTRKILLKFFSYLSKFCNYSICKLQSPIINEKVLNCWFSNKGDKTLRQEYRLNEKSLVFDIGGYEGQWSSDIFARYLCSIHIFEPVPEFSTNIARRFAKNPSIKVNPFGLGNNTSYTKIAISRDSSSIIKIEGSLVEIPIVKASDYFNQHQVTLVDLMKINIEGAEYELLDHLINEKLIHIIKDIQIQFHDFVPNAVQRRKEIQQCLQKTHFPTYDYPFVWENWRLK